MSIFKRMSSEEISAGYNAFGLLLFVIPVYLHMGEYEGSPILLLDEAGFPRMRELNWVPRPVFWLASVVYGAWLYACLASGMRARTPLIVFTWEAEEDS